tara:strand:+ start:28 stop:642 length:615 start_codon:yes stop_codon:yes gene_type:complete
MFIAAFAVVVNALEFDFFKDIENQSFQTEEELIIAGNLIDQLHVVAFISFLITFILGGIVIFKWIYRSNINAGLLGAKDMKFSPGWSVGWFFIPVVNLWKPFQAMQEIYNASLNPANWKDLGKPKIVLQWWGLWMISNSLNQFNNKKAEKAETISELINVNLLNQAGEILWIILCVTFLSLVKKISKSQLENFSLQESENHPEN